MRGRAEAASFLICSLWWATVHPMTEQSPSAPPAPPTERLSPASPDAVKDTIAYALRFNRGKASRDAAETMARIVADRIMEQLEVSGYRVMKTEQYRGWDTPKFDGGGS